MQIFIHRDDQDYGPYTVEEIQEHLATGDLLAEDHAWYEGAPDWMPLEEIPGVVPPAAQPEPEPAPKRNNTGLPAWIPPRRTEDPEHLASTPTSFATPPQRPPIGITTVTPATSKQVRSTPAATPKSTPVARPEPIVSAAPAVSNYVARESHVPVPGLTRSLRAVAVRSMIFGALWCVGGSVVTYFSYETAIAQAHGGTYLVTWGAIIFGFIQFLRGLVLYLKT